MTFESFFDDHYWDPEKNLALYFNRTDILWIVSCDSWDLMKKKTNTKFYVPDIKLPYGQTHRTEVSKLLKKLDILDHSTKVLLEQKQTLCWNIHSFGRAGGVSYQLPMKQMKDANWGENYLFLFFKKIWKTNSIVRYNNSACNGYWNTKSTKLWGVDGKLETGSEMKKIQSARSRSVAKEQIPRSEQIRDSKKA